MGSIVLKGVMKLCYMLCYDIEHAEVPLVII